MVLVEITSVSFTPPFSPNSSELLDALTKNGSSAGNGAYRRRPAESSERAGAHQDKEGQEPGAVDASKGFTKEQVEGVQRWEVFGSFFYNCISPLCLLAASLEPAVLMCFFTSGSADSDFRLLMQ